MSYIDSPDWINNKKAITNPINKEDNKCLPCNICVKSWRNKKKKDPQSITKIKPSINKYNLF